MPVADKMSLYGGVLMKRSQYLLGYRGAPYPFVPMASKSSPPAFEGTIDDLAAKHPELTPALYNDVKACEKCGKPCAATMTACNACGASLQNVAISKSENVFSAFLMGVQKAKKGFPYTISLRWQTPDVLIFDDMLALCPCHLNGISAKYYIPDWRFLLTDPPKGLELLDTMEEELWRATQAFLQNTEYRTKVLKGKWSDDQLRSKIIRSFNMPPSQFQLHVQWLLPPLVPFQHYMAEVRNHFHEDRAFPLDYVRKLLELKEPYPVSKETLVLDIVNHFNDRVNYKQMWDEFYSKALQDSVELSNWNADDFQYVVDNGKAYEAVLKDGEVCLGSAVEDVDLKAQQEKDKVAFQNYGRPYNEAGKPTGTYTSLPLQPKIGAGGYEEWPGVAKAWGLPSAL
mmetsp:Transcript_60061/g.173143  ORF Transcript_60061/g.173143 Transcript_60061/m.173143 type:complete len:399 (-) Transcript_60061:186-1382(-)